MKVKSTKKVIRSVDMRKSYSLVLMISILIILAYTNIAAAYDVYIYSTGTIGTTPGNTLFLDDPTYPDDINVMKNDVLNNTYPLSSTWGYANDETYNKIGDANYDDSYTTRQTLNGHTATSSSPLVKLRSYTILDSGTADGIKGPLSYLLTLQTQH